MPFGVGQIGAVCVPCHTAKLTKLARLSHFQTVSNKYLPGINDRRRRRSMSHLSKYGHRRTPSGQRMPLDVAGGGRVWKEIYFRSCDSLSNLVVCSVTLGRLTIS